jgi:hypothetical protein
MAAVQAGGNNASEFVCRRESFITASCLPSFLGPQVVSVTIAPTCVTIGTDRY